MAPTPPTWRSPVKPLSNAHNWHTTTVCWKYTCHLSCWRRSGTRCRHGRILGTCGTFGLCTGGSSRSLSINAVCLSLIRRPGIAGRRLTSLSRRPTCRRGCDGRSSGPGPGRRPWGPRCYRHAGFNVPSSRSMPCDGPRSLLNATLSQRLHPRRCPAP